MTAAAAGSAPSRVALMIETNGPGGAENMLVHLAAGLRRRGIEVTPVIRGSSRPSWLQQRFHEAGFEAEPCSVTRALDPAALRRLKAIMAGHRIELVHSHEFTMGVYGRVASWMAGRPHVITMHGGTGFAGRARRRRALGWALRRSEARVAVSDTTADFLAEACGLERETIDIIPNGVDVPAGDRARVRSELGLPDDELLVLAVGNLYPVKGHRTLVGAVARLTDLPLRWSVAIAGRGDEEAGLRDLIASRGLGDRVRLLGLRTDVPDLLAAADVFVMPSLSEGLPLALLEAMSAGVPVVASAVGGIPTVIREGETGMLVPPSDADALAGALGRVLTDRALRTRIASAAGAEIPRRFGVEPMVDAYLAVYRRALGRSAGGHLADQ